MSDIIERLDSINANLVRAARLKRIYEVVIGFETALIVWLVLTR